MRNTLCEFLRVSRQSPGLVQTRTLARHHPFLVFIITLSQEKSMVKTVEDIAKIAVPLIFLRFRSFLPPPSAASSVSQGHRSVPFLLP